MSGHYLAMRLSQQLAAPTNPKINEYIGMEAREKSGERERPLRQEPAGVGGRRSDVLAKSGRRTLELYYSTQVTGG
jgi:hypothetical protein